MLAIELHNNMLCPIIRCDLCGERIEDSHANVLYEMKHSEEMRQQPVHFLHKLCNREFQQQHAAVFFGWMPLDEFILTTGYNLKMWTRTENEQLQARIKKARRDGGAQ